MLSVCQAASTLLCITCTIVLIAVIASSVSKVGSDQVCEIFYQDGSTIEKHDTAGFKFVGPGQEMYCTPLSVQHMIFSSKESGLQDLIDARTAEGLEVKLELDIEYRYESGMISETLERTGFNDESGAADRLLRTARSEVRNSASRFQVTEFLTGSRELIGQEIQDRLQRTLTEKDKVYIDIVKVNLLHIDVFEPFELKFQEVEDKRLAQIQATQNRQLVQVEETRLLQTAYISAVAQRGKLIEQARSRTVSSQLLQEKEKTLAETTAETAGISAESQRKQATIRVMSELVEAEEGRRLKLQRISREVIEKKTRAATNRSNIETMEKARILLALAKRKQKVNEAKIEAEKTKASLKALDIRHELKIFQTELAASVEVEQIRASGVADAREQLRTTRSKTKELELLQDQLNLTDRGLVSVLMYRALKRSDPTVMLDYVKQPLLNEFAPTGSASAALTTLDVASVGVKDLAPTGGVSAESAGQSVAATGIAG